MSVLQVAFLLQSVHPLPPRVQLVLVAATPTPHHPHHVMSVLRVASLLHPLPPYVQYALVAATPTPQH